MLCVVFICVLVCVSLSAPRVQIPEGLVFFVERGEAVSTITFLAILTLQ